MKRCFEILPGALAWATLIFMVLFSWLLPVWMSIFIILFDIYWLLKTIYLSLHLRATFSTMQNNMKIDWLSRLDELPQGDVWKNIRHLVILPMYDKPYEVVRESFESLLAAHYPQENMHVVLALEERAGASTQEVGERITREFGHGFGAFLVTTHPQGRAGEIPGKGANEAWAGR